MTSCPCGTGRNLDDCCGTIIGGAPAPTAETLMRSRYTAFALGNVGYLSQTLSSESRLDFDEVEAENTANNATWLGLEVRDTQGGGENDETGTVEFVASFRLEGQQLAHHELATFKRENGRWVYTDGQINPKGAPRQVVKVGRNEPCPCGSGKKYKKCCGA
ncbi:YchJ family protein [Pelagibius sp. Alg239-R121]|uniref:YchJ family protein n=1 Tax=Pelagibius sp. Alg239-R121 TaxID=2993448 RepID=UPI0024A7895D|nr:YchJ family protein [Pelagibius sp. Alg239-R121]